MLHSCSPWHVAAPRAGAQPAAALAGPPPPPGPTALALPVAPALQFSFDGDRHVTPWLTIIGKHAPLPPFVEVELVRTGNTIKSGGCNAAAAWVRVP